MLRAAERAFRHVLYSYGDRPLPHIRSVRWRDRLIHDAVEFTAHFFDDRDQHWIVTRHELRQDIDWQRVADRDYVGLFEDLRARHEVQREVNRRVNDAVMYGVATPMLAVDTDPSVTVQPDNNTLSIDRRDLQFWTTPATGGYLYLSVPVNSEADRKAHARSLALLTGWLSPAQRKQYKATKSFAVTGSAGGRYRITTGRSYNVECLDQQGDVVDRICLQPVDAPAIGDIMLAQKITLETDEPAALKIANRIAAFALCMRSPPF